MRLIFFIVRAHKYFQEKPLFHPSARLLDTTTPPDIKSISLLKRVISEIMKDQHGPAAMQTT